MPDPLPADRIPARSDSDARNRYLDFLGRSLAAVHAASIWHTLPVAGEGGFHTAFTVPDTLGFSSDRGPLFLRATQRFGYDDHPRYPGERKVVTIAYAYTLAEDNDLREELFSWQWHPDAGDDGTPHLHVGRGHSEHGGLGKLHVPTARIAFEDVLLFAIRDLGLQTAIPRADAEAALAESLRRFKMFQQWS